MKTKITALRYHDICCGHRVVGHEGKCKNLHGHNYRFTFEVAPVNELDNIGRVLDFSVIKSTLCAWLEENWDHRMLIWQNDPDCAAIKGIDNTMVLVPFNPTAENIAGHFLNCIAPCLLANTGAKLVSVRIEETRKCSVYVSAC